MNHELCLIKHLFSGLHKWGIANDPATEDERFAETCFVERFGRRRQSQPKNSAPSVISGANKQLVKIRVNSWIFNTQYEIPNLALSEVEGTQYDHPIIYVPIRHYICRGLSTNQPFLCKTNPIFRIPKMYLSTCMKTNYKNFIRLAGYKNKPNFRKAQMNVNLTLTKDYRKKDDFSVRINKPNSRKTQNEHKRFFTKGL